MKLESARKRIAVSAFLCLIVFLAGSDLLRADTQEEAEFNQMVELLQLSAGSKVADIGAGGGGWTFRLAGKVGEQGHVFSTEVKEELINAINSTVKARGLKNVTVILGDQDDLRLPENCCDAAVLRLVYHAFKKPEKMRGSLRQAIKPAGIVLIIDFRPPTRQLIEQMKGAGFKVDRVIDKWRGQEGVYAAVFRKESV